MSRSTLKLVHGAKAGAAIVPSRSAGRVRPVSPASPVSAGPPRAMRLLPRPLRVLSPWLLHDSKPPLRSLPPPRFLLDPKRPLRLLNDPKRLLGPYLTPGLHVLEIGCGTGTFTIPMADMVGETGRVVAADLRRLRLAAMLENARRAGVARRVEARPCSPDSPDSSDSLNSLDLSGCGGTFGFALLFLSPREMPDPLEALRQVYDGLCPGGILLLAEPLMGGKRAFEAAAAAAETLGFRALAEPRMRLCRAVVLEKLEAA